MDVAEAQPPEMRQHASLRQPGGAGSVVNSCDVVTFGLALCEGKAAGFGVVSRKPVRLRSTGHDHIPERRAVRPELLDERAGGLAQHGKHTGRIAQHMSGVMGSGSGIHGDRHAADGHGRRHRDHHLHPGAQHHCHAFAGARPSGKIAGEVFGALEEFSAREDHTILKDHCGPRGLFPAATVDQLDHAPVRDAAPGRPRILMLHTHQPHLLETEGDGGGKAIAWDEAPTTVGIGRALM